MELVDYYVMESGHILNNLNYLTDHYSEDSFEVLRSMKKMLDAAVLLTSLTMPEDNPGHRSVVLIDCNTAFGHDTDRVVESLAEEGLTAKHSNNYGFIVGWDPELVERLSKDFRINTGDAQRDVEQGRIMGYPGCCINAYVKREITPARNNEVVFSPLHSYREHAPDCEPTIRRVRARAEWLDTHNPDLYDEIHAVLSYFKEPITLEGVTENTVGPREQYLLRVDPLYVPQLKSTKSQTYRANQLEVRALGINTRR